MAVVVFSVLLASAAVAIPAAAGGLSDAAPVALIGVFAWSAILSLTFAVIGRWRGREAASRVVVPLLWASGIAAVVWVVYLARAGTEALDEMFRASQGR